jgi:hypothetical protein
MGYVDQLSPQVGMYSFAAISLISLVMYVLSKWKEWAGFSLRRAGSDNCIGEIER